MPANFSPGGQRATIDALAARREGQDRGQHPGHAREHHEQPDLPGGTEKIAPSSIAREAAQPNNRPSTTPTSAPMSPSTSASTDNIRRSCGLVSPSARSSADSLVRSCTDRDSVLAMPSSEIRIASPSSPAMIISSMSSVSSNCPRTSVALCTWTVGIRVGRRVHHRARLLGGAPRRRCSSAPALSSHLAEVAPRTAARPA